MLPSKRFCPLYAIVECTHRCLLSDERSTAFWYYIASIGRLLIFCLSKYPSICVLALTSLLFNLFGSVSLIYAPLLVSIFIITAHPNILTARHRFLLLYYRFIESIWRSPPLFTIIQGRLPLVRHFSVRRMFADCVLLEFIARYEDYLMYER